MKATAAALKGRFAARHDEARLATWCYSGACRLARRLEPSDRYAELVVEWLSELGPGAVRSEPAPPVDLVALAEDWPEGFRPELHWRLHVLEAELRSAEGLGCLIRPLAGRPLGDLVAERLVPLLIEAEESFARLGSLARSAAPLVLRHRFEPEAPLLLWQWWARSELVRAPSESVALLTRAAEQALAEGLRTLFLDLLLDLVWARVAEGCPGLELLGTAPFEGLLYARGDLRQAFEELLDATISAPNPRRRWEIRARFDERIDGPSDPEATFSVGSDRVH